MCCGSKRSALRSASTSLPPSRATSTPAPVGAAPISLARQADAGAAAGPAQSDGFPRSAPQPAVIPARSHRMWRLTI